MAEVEFHRLFVPILVGRGHLFGRRVALVERHDVGGVLIRRKVEPVGEAVGDGFGHRVELVHRVEAEHHLDRPDHVGSGVKGRIEVLPLVVRTDRHVNGPVAVDVVGAGLRVVLDDEDAGFLPLRALRDGLDHSAEREVVVGHHGAWRGVLGIESLGVVAREAHDHQVGNLVGLAELLIFLDEDVRAVLVALKEGPVVIFVVDVGLEADERGVGAIFDLVRAGLAVFPAFEPILGHRVVLGELFVGEFAPDPQCFALLERGVPDGSGVRDGHGVVAVVGIGARVADVEVFEIFVGDALRRPLVAVGAIGSRDVAVVKQRELLGDLLMIGHHGLAEAANLGITVAQGHVSEDVVVGLVLLDDVENMLDRAVVNLERRALGVGFPAVIARHDLRGFGEVGLEVDEGDGSLKVMRVAGLADRGSPHRAVPLGVQHGRGRSRLVEHDRRWEITRRAEALDLPLGQINLGQRVVAAVGDVEGLAVGGKGVGHRSEDAKGAPFQWEGPRDLRRTKVHLADRVARRAGDVNGFARNQERRGMDADLDVSGRTRLQIDDADGSRGV